MLKIRDEAVRALAQEVMRLRGVPNMTAAIKLALQNSLRDLEEPKRSKASEKDQSFPEA